MRFAAPYWLLLLALLPVIFSVHIWEAKARRRAQRALADKELLPGLLIVRNAQGRNARLVRTWLLVAAVAFAAFSLSRPQFGLHTEVRKGRGMDVVYALDLSRSMQAKDVVPSRLERAKIELSQLSDQLPGDRIGLVGFTSVALPLCPLTVDHAALKLQLKAAEPGQLPRGGTSIGAAIDASLKLLSGGTAKSTADKAIIVITDGEEHESVPREAAERAKEAGVSVSVVGVGSASGEPIPLFDAAGRPQGYLKDRAGRTVISKLNTQLITELAQAGGGQAALPGPSGLDLSAVRDALLAKQRAELSDRVVRIYQERFQWFLGPAVLALFFMIFSRPTRPRSKGLQASLLLLALAGANHPAHAQLLSSEDSDVKAGNEALAAGDAKAAGEAYKQAEGRLGRDPRLVFNQGLADLGKGEEAQAMARFSRTVESAKEPAVRSKAAFALGNAYRRMKRFDKATESYRRALIDDPKNAAARKNLEITQRMAKLQEQQEQKDQEQKDQDQEQKDQEQKDQDQEQKDQDQEQKDQQQKDQEQKDQDQSEDQKQKEQQQKDQQSEDQKQKEQQQKEQDKKGEDKEQASKSEQQDKKKAEPDKSAAGQESKSEAEDEEAQELKQAEAILDALGQQEKALKRARLLQRYRGPAVNKDW